MPGPYFLSFCIFIVHFNTDGASSTPLFLVCFSLSIFFWVIRIHFFFQTNLRIDYALGLSIGVVLNLEIISGKIYIVKYCFFLSIMCICLFPLVKLEFHFLLVDPVHFYKLYSYDFIFLLTLFMGWCFGIFSDCVSVKYMRAPDFYTLIL